MAVTHLLEYGVLVDGVYLSFGYEENGYYKAEYFLTEEIARRKEQADLHPDIRKFKIAAENLPYLVCRQIYLGPWTPNVRQEQEAQVMRGGGSAVSYGR